MQKLVRSGAPTPELLMAARGQLGNQAIQRLAVAARQSDTAPRATPHPARLQAETDRPLPWMGNSALNRADPTHAAVQRKRVGALAKVAPFKILQELEKLGYYIDKPKKEAIQKALRDDDDREYGSYDDIINGFDLGKERPETKSAEDVIRELREKKQAEERKHQKAKGDQGLSGALEGLYYQQVVDRLHVAGYAFDEVQHQSLILKLGNLAQRKSYSDLDEVAKDLELRTRGEKVGDTGTSWEPNTALKAKFGAVTAGEKPVDGFGRLAGLETSFTAEGLQLNAEILCQPTLIAKTGDLLAVELQLKTLAATEPVRTLLGSLRVRTGGNAIRVPVVLPYATLLRLVGADTTEAEKEKALATIASISPQLGVLITWRTPDGKGEQHRSGGIEARHGFGVINVVPVTLEALRKTESWGILNVGWNESEVANVNRPLVQSFPHLIQLQKEISTTLEAESEYLIDDSQYTSILSAMTTLKEKTLEELAIYGIVREVSSSEKVYVDTYYDLELGEGKEGKGPFPLLFNDVVLRERSVPAKLNKGKGDAEGTRLIAVKGRSVRSGEEAIRLASQFEANYDLLDKEHREEVLKFLRSEQADNPFARTLRDALVHRGEVGFLSEARALKKSITVTSRRHKYQLWLANSTMIDLSVDQASGVIEGLDVPKTPTVFSFEFGVGHPGLATSGAGGDVGEVDPRVEEIKASVGNETLRDEQIKKHREKVGGLVHRPYHVPTDLNNPKLFLKGDYVQYQNLRDVLIDKLFKLNKQRLERGGNKAKVLAQAILREGGK